MKKLLIGSSQYKDKFKDVESKLKNQGHDVRIPAFDRKSDLDDLGACEYNRDLVEWCDEIHLIWDNRSSGSIFDMGMVFYSRKPLVVEYIESKTFEGVFKKYAIKSRNKLSKPEIVQVKNPKTGMYYKIDRSRGLICTPKKSPGPYKNIKIIK